MVWTVCRIYRSSEKPTPNISMRQPNWRGCAARPEPRPPAPLPPELLSAWLDERWLDIATRLLVHQPREPCRSLGNNFFNERLNLTASHATAGAAVEGSFYPSTDPRYVRLWVRQHLGTYGVEALRCYHLPPPEGHTAAETSQLYALIVGLLYHQGRVSAAAVPRGGHPVATPVCIDAAEEVETAIAVTFLCAVVEQELRGLPSAWGPRLVLLCLLPVLSILSPPWEAAGVVVEGGWSDIRDAVMEASSSALALTYRHFFRIVETMLTGDARLQLAGNHTVASQRQEGLSETRLLPIVEDLVTPLVERPSVSRESLKQCLRSVSRRLATVSHVSIPMAGILCGRQNREHNDVIKYINECDTGLLALLSQSDDSPTNGTVLSGAQRMLMQDFASILQGEGEQAGVSLWNDEPPPVRSTGDVWTAVLQWTMRCVDRIEFNPTTRVNGDALKHFY